MHRPVLTDEQWARSPAIFPPQWTGPTATLGDRSFVDALPFRARTGILWRDLPERFGPWKSTYDRLRDWSRKGPWEHIFKALRLDVDEEGCMVDGSAIRAHQDAAGGRGALPRFLWCAIRA